LRALPAALPRFIGRRICRIFVPHGIICGTVKAYLPANPDAPGEPEPALWHVEYDDGDEEDLDEEEVTPALRLAEQQDKRNGEGGQFTVDDFGPSAIGRIKKISTAADKPDTPDDSDVISVPRKHLKPLNRQQRVPLTTSEPVGAGEFMFFVISSKRARNVKHMQVGVGACA
jgi:hypothetical protein